MSQSDARTRRVLHAGRLARIATELRQYADDVWEEGEKALSTWLHGQAGSLEAQARMIQDPTRCPSCITHTDETERATLAGYCSSCASDMVASQRDHGQRMSLTTTETARTSN